MLFSALLLHALVRLESGWGAECRVFPGALRLISWLLLPEERGRSWVCVLAVSPTFRYNNEHAWPWGCPQMDVKVGIGCRQ